MSAGSTDQVRVRIVLLSREAIDAAPLSVEAAVVPVHGPLLAAAELLRQRTDVLVADLGLLGGRHGRLLELADTLGAAVVGVGSPPPGLRLLAHMIRVQTWKELPQQLRTLLAHPRPAAPARVAAHGQAADRPVMSDRAPANKVHETLRESVLANEFSEDDEFAEAAEPAEIVDRHLEREQSTSPVRPREAMDIKSLLTSEELAALLGEG